MEDAKALQRAASARTALAPLVTLAFQIAAFALVGPMGLPLVLGVWALDLRAEARALAITAVLGFLDHDQRQRQSLLQNFAEQAYWRQTHGLKADLEDVSCAAMKEVNAEARRAEAKVRVERDLGMRKGPTHPLVSFAVDTAWRLFSIALSAGLGLSVWGQGH